MYESVQKPVFLDSGSRRSNSGHMIQNAIYKSVKCRHFHSYELYKSLNQFPELVHMRRTHTGMVDFCFTETFFFAVCVFCLINPVTFFVMQKSRYKCPVSGRRE